MFEDIFTSLEMEWSACEIEDRGLRGMDRGDDKMTFKKFHDEFYEWFHSLEKFSKLIILQIRLIFFLSQKQLIRNPLIAILCNYFAEIYDKT